MFNTFALRTPVYDTCVTRTLTQKACKGTTFF